MQDVDYEKYYAQHKSEKTHRHRDVGAADIVRSLTAQVFALDPRHALLEIVDLAVEGIRCVIDLAIQRRCGVLNQLPLLIDLLSGSGFRLRDAESELLVLLDYGLFRGL